MNYAYDTTWGANVLAGGARFRLWAPAARAVSVVLLAERERTVPMQPAGAGWFECVEPSVRARTRYLYEIDGEMRVADPAARFAPDGLDGPSEVIDSSSFSWPSDDGMRRPLRELVFYELHVGAFTPEGTYAAAARHLGDLADLGVNAIELMPLAQTPGSRNWGYDGVGQYAPAHSYGTPDDLKAFVVAAHERGLRVILDVVYNHFGPEGNYLHRYAPQFFTERHHTPWGAAIDYDAPGNDAVRRYAIDNACYWLYEYRFDGLRLDATETIFDEGPVPLLRELAARARETAGRMVYLIVENDQNDVAHLREGYDAQWNDDVHHCFHVALTGERDGYYEDFAASPVALLGRALTSGYAFQGEPSPFRTGRARGAPSTGVPLVKFVNCLQNHDQIGNRALGERITELATPDAVRAATVVLLLAPSPPLLFMGEEWAASTPFLFFCDVGPELAERIAQGRVREFARFARFAGVAAPAIADPSAARTFAASKLDWSERDAPAHRAWLEFHRTLLRVRREEIAPRTENVTSADAAYETVGPRGLRARWRLTEAELQLDANLGASAQDGFEPSAPGRVLFATHDPRFPGGTAPAWGVRWTLR